MTVRGGSWVPRPRTFGPNAADRRARILDVEAPTAAGTSVEIGGAVTRDDARTLLEHLVHRIAPEVVLDEIEATAFLEEEAEFDSLAFLELMAALDEETEIAEARS